VHCSANACSSLGMNYRVPRGASIQAITRILQASIRRKYFLRINEHNRVLPQIALSLPSAPGSQNTWDFRKHQKFVLINKIIPELAHSCELSQAPLHTSTW
jgi:hypothetical protein